MRSDTGLEIAHISFHRNQGGLDETEIIRRAVLFCLTENVAVKFTAGGQVYYISPMSIVFTVKALQKEG
jgi:hypothetical protein